jgi:hypothetical protein
MAGKPQIIDSEQTRADNEQAIHERSEDRISKLVHDLQTIDVDIDMKKDDEDEDVQLRRYRGSATDGLKAILAKAAAEEAAAKGAK